MSLSYIKLLSFVSISIFVSLFFACSIGVSAQTRETTLSNHWVSEDTTIAHPVPNGETIVGTFSFTGTDRDYSEATYALSATSSFDNEFFVINGDTLSFLQPPDFENPIDKSVERGGIANDNNYYILINTVRKTNNNQYAYYASIFLITVTNEEVGTAKIIKAIDDVGILTGDLTSEDFTDDTLPTLSGTVPSTFDSSTDVLSVYNGETKLGDVDNANIIDTAWTYQTSSELSDGTHSFTAKITDGAGSEEGTSLIFFLTVDTATNTSPDFGSSTISDEVYEIETEITDLVLPTSTHAGIYKISPELPRSLSFDSSTRTISGRTTELQSSTQYTYTSSNSVGKASLTFNIEVIPRIAGTTSLDNSTISENTTMVGTFSTTGDVNSTQHTYHFVPGETYDDNEFFVINGDVLSFIDPPDFENPTGWSEIGLILFQKNRYAVYIEARNHLGEKSIRHRFIISVTDDTAETAKSQTAAPGIKRIPQGSIVKTISERAGFTGIIEPFTGDYIHVNDVSKVFCTSYIEDCEANFEDASKIPFNIFGGVSPDPPNIEEEDYFVSKLNEMPNLKIVSASFDLFNKFITRYAELETEPIFVFAAGNEGRDDIHHVVRSYDADRVNSRGEQGTFLRADGTEFLLNSEEREQHLKLIDLAESNRLLIVSGLDGGFTGKPYQKSVFASGCGTYFSDVCIYARFHFPPIAGTSFATPQLSSALASILAAFPDTEPTDLVKLVKACAVEEPGLDALGRIDFTCLTRDDGNGGWEFAEGVAEHGIAALIPETPTQVITINDISGDNYVNATEAASVVTISGTSVDIDGGENIILAFTGDNSAILITAAPVTEVVGSVDTWTVDIPVAQITGAGQGDVEVTASYSGATDVVKTFTIDTVSPTSAPTLSITDTGSNTSDGITNNSTVTVTGEANAKFEYEIDDSGTWTTVTESTFNLLETTTAQDYRTRQTDLAGNVSPESSAYSFRYDETAPTLQTTNEIQDQTATVGENFTLAIPSTYFEGGTITYTSSGEAHGITFNTETNTWSGVPTSPSIFTITVTATDEAGNEATQPFRVSVSAQTRETTLSNHWVSEDTTIAHPVPNGETMVGTFSFTGNDRSYSEATHVLVATSSYDNGFFVINGDTLSFSTAPDFENPEDRSVERGGTANDNNYHVLIYTINNQDNLYYSHFLITVTDTNEEPPGDSTPQPTPTQVITINDISGDNYVNATEAASVVTISGTSVDIDGGENIILAFTGDNSAILITAAPVTEVVGSVDTWTVDIPVAQITGAGQGDVEVTASYSGATDVVKTFTIDTVAPAVGTPISNQDATVNSEFTFEIPSGTFTAETPALTYTSSGEGSEISFATNTWTGTPTTAETLNITLTATDVAGNTTDTSFTITISAAVVVASNSAPVIAFSPVTANTTPKQSFGLTIDVVDSNVADNVSAEYIQIASSATCDAAAVSSGTTAISGTGSSLSTTLTFTLESDNDTKICVVANDNGSPVRTVYLSSPAIAEIDTTAPTTTVAITHATDNVGGVTDNLSSGDTTDDDTPGFVGTISEALGTGESVVVYEGTTLLGTATTTGTSWTYTPSAISEGNKVFSAKAVDLAGNEGTFSPTFSLTIDTTTAAPSFGSNTVSNQSYVRGTVITNLVLPSSIPSGTYSITPTPPTGLTFAPETRTISGTPSVETSSTVYTYESNNFVGKASLTFSIRVTTPTVRRSGGGGGGGGSSSRNSSKVITVPTTPVQTVQPSEPIPVIPTTIPENTNAETPIQLRTGLPTRQFRRNLSIRAVGTDVKELQEFLNNNGFPVSNSGAGSKGQETEFFGPATQRALAEYQETNDIPETGYLGEQTRQSIQKNILINEIVRQIVLIQQRINELISAQNKGN